MNEYDPPSPFGYPGQLDLSKRGSTLVPPVDPSTFEEIVLRDASASSGGTTWAINLASWVFPSPDAFVAVKARVRVGTEGGNDDFLVDYPQAGTAFSVQGQNLVVSLVGELINPTLNPRRPVLGAWLTTKPGGCNRPMSATFTTNTETVPAASGTVFDVPRRARAYRINTIGLFDAAGTLSVLQLDSRPTPSDLITDVITNAVDYEAPTSRAQWFPLHPNAKTIVVSNDTAGDASLNVQFLLETCA